MTKGDVQVPLDPDSSPSQSVGSPPEERTTTLFQRLEKALRLRRLYAPRSRLSQASLDELAAEMASYLEEFEYLDLTVTPDALLTGETAHLKGPRSEASIAFRLHRDGIRSLRFRAGLTREEIDRLLRVLEHQSEGDQKFDDDLTGELAIVFHVDPAAPRRPLVKVVRSPDGADLPEAGIVDLGDRDGSGVYRRSIAGTVDSVSQGINIPSYLWETRPS